jgi:hypothetical protein
MHSLHSFVSALPNTNKVDALPVLFIIAFFGHRFSKPRRATSLLFCMSANTIILQLVGSTNEWQPFVISQALVLFLECMTKLMMVMVGEK